MAGHGGIDIRKPTTAKPWRRPRYLVAAGLVLLLAVMALNTTYVDADADAAQSGTGTAAFDPEAFGAGQFPRVAAAVQESAAELPELLAALAADPDAAGERYGNQGDVTSPHSFPVRGTGTAGAAESGMLPVAVEGIPGDVTVQIQIGPVLRGTTLRDVVDFIHFDQFVNQLEYAEAARALNDQVLAQTLAGFDAEAATGGRIRFAGAFTMLSASVVTITPVELEVAP